MLTLTTDGEVSLWDAQKMSVLQTVRNKNYVPASKISSMAFFPPKGLMLLATSKVYKWVLQEDVNTRIQIDQQHTVARDFLTQMAASMRRAGLIN